MIKITKITECDNPKFIKPKRVFFIQNDKDRNWEVVEAFDSVAILLYDKSEESFILVKQFRPAVYMKNGDGFTYELCAGLIDKQKPIETIAKEEVYEECGYDIDESDLLKITSFYSSVGFAGARQTLFFAKVSTEQKKGKGGGIDDENIEIVPIRLRDAKSFMFDESKAKTPGLLFAFMWFFENYKK